MAAEAAVKLAFIYSPSFRLVLWATVALTSSPTPYFFPLQCTYHVLMVFMTMMDRFSVQFLPIRKETETVLKGSVGLYSACGVWSSVLVFSIIQKVQSTKSI